MGVLCDGFGKKERLERQFDDGIDGFNIRLPARPQVFDGRLQFLDCEVNGLTRAILILTGGHDRIN
ncbi:MAG: hypothetical protein WBW88_01975 [Rhodothermales bacterium]